MGGVSRRSVLAWTLVGTAAWLARAPAAAAAEDITARARALVEELITNGLSVLSDSSLGRAERVQKFRVLFERYFAVDVIARWVLGRYWRQATEAQQATYRKLFEDLITYGYVKRFGDYGGEQVHVISAVVTGDNAVTVNTEIDQPSGGAPIAVDWRVGVHDGTYLITDVIVASVSLALTWRSDFAATIQQHGGSIDAFLASLRERVAALKAEVEGG